MAPELQDMSKAELESLKDDIDAAIKREEDRKRKDALAAARAAAEEHGFTLDDLLKDKSRPSSAGKRSVRARYRHPQNPALTWAGRGRRPAWLDEELAKGKSLKDFAVE